MLKPNLYNKPKKYLYAGITLLFMLVLFSCHEPIEVDDLTKAYSEYNRVVGSNGGVINYFNDFNNDREQRIAMTLTIDPGVLDSLIVFNFHEFEDYSLTKILDERYAKLGSKFFYLMPFNESNGINYSGISNDDYNPYVQFNDSVEIDYYFYNPDTTLDAESLELQQNFYGYCNPKYQLYRLKIPKPGQWFDEEGEANDIPLAYNSGKYVDGYDLSAIYRLITGSYSFTGNDYQSGVNLINWEKIENVKYTLNEHKISFKAKSMNYIYVLAKVRVVESEDFPPNVLTKIQTFINENFYDTEINQISLIDEEYLISLSNNYELIFDEDGDFKKATNCNESLYDLPQTINDYIANNYSNQDITNICYITDEDGSIYEIVINNNTNLIFTEDGELTGFKNNNISETEVPNAAINYINNNFPNLIIADISSSLDEVLTYTITTTNRSSFIFYEDGSLFSIKKMVKYSDLPSEILKDKDLITYYTNHRIKEIFHDTEISNGVSKEAYYIIMKDDVSAIIFSSLPKDNYKIEYKQIVFYNLDYIKDINVINVLSKIYPDAPLTYSFYIYDEEEVYTSVYAVYLYYDEVIIKISNEGEILSHKNAYNPEYSMLPVELKNKISEYVDISKLDISSFDFSYDGDYEDDLWELELSDESELTFDSDYQIKSMFIYNPDINKLPGKVQTYIELNNFESELKYWWIDDGDDYHTINIGNCYIEFDLDGNVYNEYCE